MNEITDLSHYHKNNKTKNILSYRPILQGMQANRFVFLFYPLTEDQQMSVYGLLSSLFWSDTDCLLNRPAQWDTSGALVDKCSCACYLAASLIHFSVRPGGTPRRGRLLSACGRKGSKEWQNWELRSILRSHMSPVLSHCRTVVYSQRQGGSIAVREKEM